MSGNFAGNGRKAQWGAMGAWLSRGGGRGGKMRRFAFDCPPSILASATTIIMSDINLLNLGSLGGSATALISTFYFWLVRANRERPQLQPYLVHEIEGTWPTIVRDSYCRVPEGHVLSRYFVRLAVANYSSLPNAVLRAKASIKMRDGSWKPADTRVGEGHSLPANVAPMTTAPLDLRLEIVVPGSLEGTGTAERNANAFSCIANPAEIRVELIALGEKKFRADLKNFDPNPETSPA